MRIKKLVDPPNLDSPEFKLQLGRRIKMLRKKAGMTQTELQEALDYDSSGMISLIENGKTRMSIDQIYKAASVFNVHPFFLLTDEDLNDEKMSIILGLSKILKSKEKSKHLDTIKDLISIAESQLK